LLNFGTIIWLLGFSGYKMIFSLLSFEKKGIGGDLKSLDNLLRHRKGFDSFLAYMKTEFNGENVLFWQAIQEFRDKHLKQFNFDACLADVEVLLNTYILPGCLMELNLNDSLRQELIKALEHYRKLGEKGEQESHGGSIIRMSMRADGPKDPTTEQIGIVTMFDTTQTAVYDMMRVDPFRRYLASKLYAEFKASEPSMPDSRNSRSQKEARKSLVNRALEYLTTPKMLPTVPGSREASKVERDSRDSDRDSVVSGKSKKEAARVSTGSPKTANVSSECESPMKSRLQAPPLTPTARDGKTELVAPPLTPTASKGEQPPFPAASKGDLQVSFPETGCERQQNSPRDSPARERPAIDHERVSVTGATLLD